MVLDDIQDIGGCQGFLGAAGFRQPAASFLGSFGFGFLVDVMEFFSEGEG